MVEYVDEFEFIFDTTLDHESGDQLGSFGKITKSLTLLSLWGVHGIPRGTESPRIFYFRTYAGIGSKFCRIPGNFVGNSFTENRGISNFFSRVVHRVPEREFSISWLREIPAKFCFLSHVCRSVSVKFFQIIWRNGINEISLNMPLGTTLICKKFRQKIAPSVSVINQCCQLCLANPFISHSFQLWISDVSINPVYLSAIAPFSYFYVLWTHSI